MQNGEKGFEPVWCPFYREDSGRSIYCEGITDESFLRLTFASGRAKRQQMEIFCRTKHCETVVLLSHKKLREMRALYGHQREVCG